MKAVGKMRPNIDVRSHLNSVAELMTKEIVTPPYSPIGALAPNDTIGASHPEWTTSELGSPQKARPRQPADEVQPAADRAKEDQQEDELPALQVVVAITHRSLTER